MFKIVALQQSRYSLEKKRTQQAPKIKRIKIKLSHVHNCAALSFCVYFGVSISVFSSRN